MSYEKLYRSGILSLSRMGKAHGSASHELAREYLAPYIIVRPFFFIRKYSFSGVSFVEIKLTGVSGY